MHKEKKTKRRNHYQEASAAVAEGVEVGVGVVVAVGGDFLLLRMES